MKKYSILKKIVKIFLALTIIMSITNIKYAKALTLSDILSGGEQFLRKGDNASDDLFDADKEKNAVDQAYVILLGIAIIAAFIIGAVLGIQFITSGAVGQAKVKEKLIPYVVGLFVVFGAFGIWQIALRLGRTLTEAPPAYLTSTDTADVVIAPTGDVGDRAGSRRHTYNEGGDVESVEIQDLAIYLINVDSNIDLPIYEITINISVSDTQSMSINANSIQGCNGYNATFDEASNTIKITYGNSNNIPSVYNGEQICKFEMAYTDVCDWEYDGIHMVRENFDLYDKTYTTSITSVECYDKDRNNITRNVNIGGNNQLTIEYKFHMDSVIHDAESNIEDIGEALFDFLH